MRRLFALVLLVVLGMGACTEGRAPARPLPVTRDATLGRMLVHIPAHSTTVGVVVLHSYGSDETQPVRQGWDAASDRYGFVALYPSRSDSWNAGLCCGAAAALGRDDVTWLTSLIADARRRYGLTTVFVAGFSNGGMMAERLVAERRDVTGRIATWGSAPEMPRPGRWTGLAVLYSGERDATVPPTGGLRVIGRRLTLVRPSAETSTWLPGAHLQSFVVAGAGHSPPPGWPDLAWRALSAPPGLAPGG